MDESRRQFEEVFKNWHPDKVGPYMKHIAEYFWQASRQSQQVVAYLTHQGSAVSPDDFEGGEAEMHETAKREEWFPLVKKGE
ncbi:MULTISPECIES: hypothetical protein [unclassified Tatumella]|uniref:hypothetical protein n=1 Tax=unclassified Tatumella TaxID=2649542 RepID=UPI001BAE6E2B|nr:MULTISPECIES: hypothetical protein [unclassified Tatumella]MBS0857257.1 hypothetical protein [Tatumella sp. JGM16]MBS0914010.1 hypothetical protein [Tatumella sp. JGM91]